MQCFSNKILGFEIDLDRDKMCPWGVVPPGQVLEALVSCSVSQLQSSGPIFCMSLFFFSERMFVSLSVLTETFCMSLSEN